jgi:Skp family chaperone for outer membrane proteins
MKRTALITATLFAAAFASSAAHAFVGAEESGEVFFTLYDASASAPDPSVESQEAKDKQQKDLDELREQIYRDMLHE